MLVWYGPVPEVSKRLVAYRWRMFVKMGTPPSAALLVFKYQVLFASFLVGRYIDRPPIRRVSSPNEEMFCLSFCLGACAVFRRWDLASILR